MRTKKIIIGELIIDVSPADYGLLVDVCIYEKTDKEKINNLLADIVIKYEKTAIRADQVFYVIK